MCKESNEDGTHVLEASYKCSCGEIILLTKEQNCEFVETIKRNPIMHNLDNIHIVEMDCEVCGFHKEENAPCVPDNINYYFYYLSQIYKSYHCIVCENTCNQVPHFFHELGEEWKYHDENTHRKQCECTTEAGRQEEYHDYALVEGVDNMIKCTGCGHEKEVEPHQHGYGFAGKWEVGLMDLVLSPAYDELVDKGQIKNPYPSPNAYCSKYDFICHTCHARYSCYFAHSRREDGTCARGYCDHMMLD